MNQMILSLNSPNDDSDCFGEYNSSDPLCLKHCVLRLRCAIEQDHNIRTEMIEELVAYDNELGKMQ
jgi:hypothetical protein